MLKLVKSNVEQTGIIPTPPMWCFGGHNVTVEIDKIKTCGVNYWYDKNQDIYIPVLLFELQDGTKISVDYDTTVDAEEALKCFRKSCGLRVVKDE